MHRHLIRLFPAVILFLALGTAVHAIGPVTSLIITPSTKTVIAGETQQFTVTGTDADGVTADLTANSTFTTTDPRGFTTADIYTAGKTGTWSVTAKYNDLTQLAAVTVTPGAISDLVVNPNSLPEFIVNGASRTFTAGAFDALDNPLTDFTVKWSVEGIIGSVTSSSSTKASFTASQNGRGRIVARSGDAVAMVDVTVTPSSAADSNTNANSNTNAGSNANRNVNSAANVNSASNTNSGVVPGTTNDNENTNASGTASSCTAWPRTAWVWIFLLYVVLLVGSLVLMRNMRVVWWWVIPLSFTVVALWLYFQYRCYPLYPAWPYLILLAAILATSWYTWQKPNQQPPMQ